ncbi:glycosyltransferase [Shewanella vesiculosa]|uniref:glycosyltransferase n=1 Tax=Shewanella vesiculosa TaxID=518738 RepID=UPI003D085FE8
MKVLIVYHYIALYREPIFKELLNNSEIDFYFAASKYSNNDIKLVGLESEIYESEHFFELNNQWVNNSFLWQSNLLKVLRENHFDHVVFLGDPHFISTWISLFYLKMKKVKTSLWTHGFIGRSHKFQDSLKLLMYKLSDVIFLYGEEAKADLIYAGLPSSKLSVIYNSLDYLKQKETRESLSYNDSFSMKQKLFANFNDLQLFFIGRLTKHKKLDMLIDAINVLAVKDVRVNVLFIGDGESSDELKEKVKQYSLEKQFYFYGATHDEFEIAKLIFSSDVCVAPGEVGLTAMHSLAYGVPVITHDNRFKQMPEYESIIHNETGLLFEYDSIDSLANNIEKVVNLIGSDCRDKCINIIESKYNPSTQVKLFTKTLKLL